MWLSPSRSPEYANVRLPSAAGDVVTRGRLDLAASVRWCALTIHGWVLFCQPYCQRAGIT
jgi:hypothetical protein